MGGPETLVELKKVARDLADVIVSGYLTPAEAERCLALGAFAVVRKPFSVEDLLGTLRRARDTGTRDKPPASGTIPPLRGAGASDP